MTTRKKWAFASFMFAGAAVTPWAEYDNWRLRYELGVFAETQKASFTAPSETGVYEVAAPVVTASRRFFFFGTPRGKVTLFVRAAKAEGHEEGENNGGGDIAGVDYFLERSESWTVVESSACSSERCRIEGKRAFASLE